MGGTALVGGLHVFVDESERNQPGARWYLMCGVWLDPSAPQFRVPLQRLDAVAARQPTRDRWGRHLLHAVRLPRADLWEVERIIAADVSLRVRVVARPVAPSAQFEDVRQACIRRPSSRLAPVGCRRNVRWHQ